MFVHRARLSYPPTIIFSRALQLFSNIYYPKGNFEGNQLQDSSISLSPQHTNSRNKLQLRKTTNLHQNFLRLQTSSSVAHHLSGPNMHAFTNKLRKKIIVTRRLSFARAYKQIKKKDYCNKKIIFRKSYANHGFPIPLYLLNTQFAHTIDSLVRVSRRFDKST